jgi:hypothetical protein
MKKNNNIILFFTCILLTNTIILILFSIIIYIILNQNAGNISNYTLDVVEINETLIQKNNKYYTMMDFFSNKNISYFPSCFIKNEYLIDNNFTYKSLNYTLYYDIGMESERAFLIRLSGTLLDIMRSNNENIASLQNFFNE